MSTERANQQRFVRTEALVLGKRFSYICISGFGNQTFGSFKYYYQEFLEGPIAMERYLDHLSNTVFQPVQPTHKEKQMRSGIVIIIGRPCTDSTNMVSETFSREVARSACPNGLRAEHEAKIALLRKLNIAFMEFDMPEGAPNGIYTRDPAAFSALGRVLFCNMRHPERRPEVQVFKNSIGTQNRQICVPETFCVADRGGPDAFLEGGDIMQFDDHGKHRVVLFLSRRSNHQGIEVGKLFFEWEGYRVDVVESAELHGTSAISVIGNNTVLVNPAKIDLHAIQRLGVKTLLVPERERDTLAANVAWYPVGNCNASRDVVVCNSDHMETADMLDQAGYQVERIPFANHHLAEGNTDCAMGQRFATCFG